MHRANTSTACRPTVVVQESSDATSTLTFVTGGVGSDDFTERGRDDEATTTTTIYVKKECNSAIVDDNDDHCLLTLQQQQCHDDNIEDVSTLI